MLNREWLLVPFIAIGGLVSLAGLILLIRRGWRMDLGDRRLRKAQYPNCEYPLRFNGTEHWCSECGFKHPLRVDSPVDSGGEEVVGDERVER